MGGMATLCMSSSGLLNQHQFANISRTDKRNSLCCKCIEASWEKLCSQFAHRRRCWTRPRRSCRFEARVSNSERLREDTRSQEKEGKLRVGLICGGPSAERGISLNSARSVLDHLQGVDVDVQCFYLDKYKRPYAISPTQVYCNTPSDFDFKLGSTAQAFETLQTFLQHLQSAVDIVFPAMHGKFGEDGGIQELLESAGIPFVGTDACSARRAFDKFTSSQELSRLGFVTLPNFLVQDGLKDAGEVANWFTDNQLDLDIGRVVVKPTCAGSSIGVSVAYGVEDALQKSRQLLNEGVDDRVLMELFVEGVEFTAIVLDVGSRGVSHPVALMPTEIELQLDVSSLEGSIFDYRKKYLPSRQVSFHTPARFPTRVVQEIRNGAAQLFQQLGLKDFARIDGWYMSSASTRTLNGRQTQRDRRIGELEDGTFLFSDINLISGMEQTSFLFQQAAQVGLSHADILRSVLFHACSRFAITPPSSVPRMEPESSNNAIDTREASKKKVYVIFGGHTSEKQVSLMSGTNVWLNLRACTDLDVHPFLLAPTTGTDLEEAFSVWALPYSAVLRHTVEEVIGACVEALQPEASAATEQLREEIVSELKDSSQLQRHFISRSINVEHPRQMTLLEWIQEAKKEDAVVFIAVHGGIGEDGTLQALLESQRVFYTGSGIRASRLCANKAATGAALSNLAHQGVYAPMKKLWVTSDLLAGFDSRTSGEDTVHAVWKDLKEYLKSESICVKPASDGCSTGVAKLCCAKDLFFYLKALCEGVSCLLPGTLSEAHGIVEMPPSRPELMLFEPFIETDAIIVASQSRVSFGRLAGGLFWEGKSRWVEVTVGVMGRKNQMRSFSPSITVKESGSILSLEEKFQGGTGVNLTPPPPSIMSEETIKSIKQRIELVAATLGLEGFARIDAFAHADTGEVIVIEVNTIPGMTPSTVLIHQALAEDPPVFPRMFFRHALDLALDGVESR